MTVFAFDSPDPDAVAKHANALYLQGARGAIVYISPGFPAGSKTVKARHIKDIHAAGIAIGFVCEWWGGSDNFKHHDITADYGKRDGAFCKKYMEELGAPAGTGIYPTVDNDVNSTQLKNYCIPYFKAFHDALEGQYKLGAYGPGALLFALEALDPKILDLPWLSNAMGWNRSKEYLATGRAIVTQKLPTHLLGIDIDPDIIKDNDLAAAGFWLVPQAAPLVA